MASHGIALHSEGFLGCPGQELELFDDMLYLGSKTREGMVRTGRGMLMLITGLAGAYIFTNDTHRVSAFLPHSQLASQSILDTSQLAFSIASQLN